MAYLGSVYILDFFKQHICKQNQAKIGKKNQTNAKQHSEAKLLLF